MTQAAAAERIEIAAEGLSKGKLTLLASAGLFALYWAYSLVVSPSVRPPSVNAAATSQADGASLPKPLRNIEMAKRYLPHAKWAGDARYHLTTANAYIYAETWTRVDSDKAIRFKPFAIIWMQKGRKFNEDPITIVSDSAYVRFARKFEIAKPNPGRVIAGSLEGNVEIRGPNGMKVAGRNFSFSEQSMRMWSDAPVQFEYGPHRGRADGLECDLLASPEARSMGRFAVNGIQSIRLRRNVAMDFVFQGSGKDKLFNSPDERQNQSDETKKPIKKPTLVRVRSKGRFEFDVQTNVATFEDDVRVFRPTKPGMHDILLCDLLTLIFEPAPDKPKERASPGHTTVADSKPQPRKKKPENGDPEKFRGINGRLTFQRLRAQPRYPHRHVQLISQANQLTAKMDDLIYDSQSKIAVLRDRDSVQVLQETSETRAPKITLLQDQKGTVTSLLCEGAGWIKHSDKKTGKVDLSASWTKWLRKFPDPNSMLDVIELQDDAMLQQPEQQSALTANFIRIWMDRRKKRKKDGDEVADTEKEEDKKQKLKLRRLLALNNVEMSSPDMQAHTKRLEVWFTHLDEQTPAGRVPSGRRPRSNLQPTGRRVGLHRSSFKPRQENTAAWASVTDTPGFLRVDAPRGSTSRQPVLGGITGSDRDGPLEIWSELIRVRIQQGRNKAETQMKEVWTIGDVRVKQQHKPGDEPLRITGDRMHITAEAKDDHVLHVYGAPAHIRDRGMHIEGENIHLDRARNHSWVDGSGLLQLPVNRTLNGRKLDKPELLDVWWKKSMNFDGEMAKFRGQVRAFVENSRIRCQELDVQLTERIPFGQRGRDNKQKPEVKTVVCRDGVEVDSYEYQENKLTEIRRAHVEQFTVHQSTGDTLGEGPGWIIVWRRGQGPHSRYGRKETVRANKAAKTKKQSGWTYSRIDFAGKTSGNIKQKFNRFERRVQIVYGPVLRPPHVIDLDADQLPEDSGWLRCKQLTVTQRELPETKSSYMTMLADGNAEVNGRGFHGRADHITYDESQDLYTLRCLGSRDATIWRQTKVGGKRHRADAQRMQFIPSKNILKLDRTTRLEGLR